MAVVKSRRLTEGEGTCTLRKEIEIDFDGKHAVVLYKFLL